VVKADDYFSKEEIARSRAYHRPLYRLLILTTVLGLAYFAVLAFTPVGRWLAAPVDGLPLWAEALLYAALVVLLGSILRLPLSFWRGYVYEHRWSFSTQSRAAWLADWAKAVGVSVILTSLSLLAFVEVAATLPRTWPLVAGPGVALLVVILSLLGPLILEPLFNRFSRLQDLALADELRALARRAGVGVRDLLVADASRRTRKENAYVSGLGRTRRVVVFDTLLARADPRDVKLVVAHELGHWRDRHVVKGTALAAADAAATIVILWLCLRSAHVVRVISASGPADPRIAPFVLFVAAVLGLAAQPVGLVVSRRWEAAADQASVELTSDREGFAKMTRDLAVSNLSDLDPSRLAYVLLFTHPTPPERIAASLSD
jgi:STE24 endopeptidase